MDHQPGCTGGIQQILSSSDTELQVFNTMIIPLVKA